MLTVKDFESELAEIVTEWNNAEETVKIAEQLGGKVVWPSVKELRYAGRRLADILQRINTGASTEKDIRELLADAKFDCLRARHDAIDSASATMAAELKVAVQKLKYTAVLTAFPDYAKLLARLNKVRASISKSRKNRENREEIYAALQSVDFGGLVDAYREFQEAEQLMREIASGERRTRLIDRGLAIGGVAVGVVGIVIGVILAQGGG